MDIRIQTRFDIGDIAVYKEVRLCSCQDVPEEHRVKITELRWCMSLDGISIDYGIESIDTDKNDYLGISVPMTRHNILESELFQIEGIETHPIDIRTSCKHTLGKSVFSVFNNDIYGIIAPRPFVVKKVGLKRKVGFEEFHFLCGYCPMSDSQWWGFEEEMEMDCNGFIDELPKDYLEKLWKVEYKDKYFSPKGKPYKTNFEMLFKYLKIEDEARLAYYKWLNKLETKHGRKNKFKRHVVLKYVLKKIKKFLKKIN